MEQKVIAVLKEVLEMENKEINLTDHFRDYEEWSSFLI
jgi:acyl carrier protein